MARYRLLNSTFYVTYNDAELRELIHPLLAHLEDGSPPALHKEELLLARTAGGFIIFLNGEIQVVSDTPDGMGPLLKDLLLRKALSDHGYLFHLHAAVLERNGRCLLLPGASGSGKTCLTAGLLHAGWNYLSDETAPLDHASLRVRPVPMAMALKKGAWDVLQPYQRTIRTLPIHLREDGKRVRYLPPPRASMAPDRFDGYPVSWIIFPRFKAGRRSGSLVPVSKSEALQLLFGQCLSMPVDLDCSTVEGIVTWIRGIQTFLLTSSDLERAIGPIHGMVDDF